MNAVKDKIEGGIRTVFTHEGLELKKRLIVSMGKFNPFPIEIRTDSASLFKKRFTSRTQDNRQNPKD